MSSAPPASTDRAAHWDRVFRTTPVDKASWHQARPETSLRAVHRAAGELTRSRSGEGTAEVRVLDAGAGASLLPDWLLRHNDQSGLKYRFKVTVLDISEAALGITRARLEKEQPGRLGDAGFVCADVAAYRPAVANQVDIWHDRAVLHFLLDTAAVAGYVKTMRDSMVPGRSFAFVETFAPDGPEKCSGLPVRRYSADELDAALNAAGKWLERVEEGREVHVTPAGKDQRFQWVLFRDVRDGGVRDGGSGSSRQGGRL
ncbi:nodulation protein S [Hyaloraphidium curvatum]|nr:nodulation protein S [Hyaloraphidium curvatum]